VHPAGIVLRHNEVLTMALSYILELQCFYKKLSHEH